MNSFIYIILGCLFLILLFKLILVMYLRLNRQRRIRELLTRLVDEFEINDVVYWVDFGSLLGIARDGDVILGDNDGDVCVINTSENMRRVSRIVKMMGGEYLEWGAFRVYDESIFIDIYVQGETDTHFKNPTGETISKEMIMPTQKKRVKLGNNMITITTPRAMFDVLENRYGSKWKQSKRRWYTLYYDLEKDFN